MAILIGDSTIIGNSAWSVGIRSEIERIAKHDANVLITGPTGTGKGVMARAIHLASRRAEMPFVPTNCACILGSLYASQLFGHRKGAFTGSSYEAMGCFRAADGGTIFLDEIAELKADLQSKLLQVIQDRHVHPVGSDTPVPVNVRIVCATNRNLANDVASGRFREDLYYRLHVIPLHAAPLKERREDVEPLARHFLGEAIDKYGAAPIELTTGAVEYLTLLDWPGNVRQLRHVMEQALIYCDGPEINLDLVRQLIEDSEPGAMKTRC